MTNYEQLQKCEIKNKKKKKRHGSPKFVQNSWSLKNKQQLFA